MKKEIEIPMTECVSSQIHSHGYDASTNTLAIKFGRGGALYHYSNVPKEIADGLAKAESVGKYFGAEIKGKFEHTKV